MRANFVTIGIKSYGLDLIQRLRRRSLGDSRVHLEGIMQRAVGRCGYGDGWSKAIAGTYSRCGSALASAMAKVSSRRVVEDEAQMPWWKSWLQVMPSMAPDPERMIGA